MSDWTEAIAAEQAVLARARKAAAELIAAAVELGWYTDDPEQAAMGHVQAVLMERGQWAPRPASERTRKRRKKLPYRIVWDRDNWKCVHCGSHQNLTVDHIKPWSKGGSDDPTNLQTLCGSCNSQKGARC